MDLTLHSIQPITSWVHYHPKLALFFTFLVSFVESLALIGSIVPGSVTMTLVGILAGSGAMRIDLTLVAATIGAIAGDWGSYFIGYAFSDRLYQLWPFSRYPQWLTSGKTFFERHGGKSVFLGRFVGPLRSIIPVIAGMLHMRKLNFLAANALSAIAWSVIYISPGILIGAASTRLTAENASHLLLLVLGTIFFLWLTSVLVKWLWTKIHGMLKHLLHTVWSKLLTIPYCGPLFQTLTPMQETNHATTAGFLCLVLCLLGFIGFLMTSLNTEASIEAIDSPLYFFLQSLRNPTLDTTFIFITLFTSHWPTMSFVMSQLVTHRYIKNWKAIRYWVSLCFFSAISTYGLVAYMIYFGHDPLLANQYPPLRPLFFSILSTACLSFYGFQLYHYPSSILSRWLRIALINLILFSGVGLLYLGESPCIEVITAYSIGLALSLIHWLMYRRASVGPIAPLAHFVTMIVFIGAAIVTVQHNFIHTRNELKTLPKAYVLKYETWKNQNNAILPRYTTNRLGKPIGLFNIQYVGSSNKLQTELNRAGWVKHPASLVDLFDSQTIHAASQFQWPVRTSFYLSQKPILIMTLDKPAQTRLIFTLWRSNYYLENSNVPIWIGSIQPYRPFLSNLSSTWPSDLVTEFLAALNIFKITTQPFPSPQPSIPNIPNDLSLILIEE